MMLFAADQAPVHLQNVSFAPPEGFMDVDTTAAKGHTSPISEPATSPSAKSALQEVAANLASVKSAIRSGAADRNLVIDMLTNLLRETLQVTHLQAHHALSSSPSPLTQHCPKHMAPRQLKKLCRS